MWSCFTKFCCGSKSKDRDEGLPSVTNGGMLGTEFNKGDRVCILSKNKYKGRAGRIYFIHSAEEIWIQFDNESGNRSKDPSLSDAVKVEDLILIPPLYSGYCFEYASHGIFSSWTKRFFEVWDTHVSSRDDEHTYELGLNVNFAEKSCCIADAIPGAEYPFGNNLPKICNDIKTHMIMLKHDGDIVYIVAEPEELESFRKAVDKAISICLDMKF